MLTNDSLSVIVISRADKLWDGPLKRQILFYMEIQRIKDMTHNQNAEAFGLHLDLSAELFPQGSGEDSLGK